MADSKKVPDSGAHEAKPKTRPRPPRAGMGRPAGAKNKVTTTLKEAILLAAEQVGEDGQGRDGLTGYLRSVAIAEPKAFCGLLGRVLPIQANLAGPNGEALPPAQMAPVFNVTLSGS